VIDLASAAASRTFAIRGATASDQAFRLTSFFNTVSAAETALYILTLGNGTNGTVQTSWVEYFFGKHG
jgi:hypothetical protein